MTDQEIANIMLRIWNAIGPDATESMMGDELTHEIACEFCFDADRPLTFGGGRGPEFQKWFRALIREVGHVAARRRLEKIVEEHVGRLA